MTEPAVIRLTLHLPDGTTIGSLIEHLSALDPDNLLIGRHILEILDASSPALTGPADDGPIAVDRVDRARTAPDRAAAARVLTDGEPIPSRRDLAALLRDAGWPCSTDNARDLCNELAAERARPVGPELTAGTRT